MPAGKNGSAQRNAILRKSSILFWEKGYAETSMKDIASACGFRPANIYNYFDKKETILFEILRGEMDDIVGPIRRLADEATIDPVEALRAVIDNHLRHTLGERRGAMLLFDVGLNNLSAASRKKIVSLRDEYDTISISIIRRGIDSGVFRDMDPRMAVFSISSMIARSRIWYSPKGRYSIGAIGDFIFDFAMKGMEKR
ncbi:MAG: TetR family transcriptional regulator [Spirochaetes bacterium]|jgi:AcrR family transcriptional regulator|nr:TetR family transcriptional regulator [Spirochaetota bacterium]